jgi:hypothetical protein
LFWIVRVVSLKLKTAPGFHPVEHNHPMIDGQRRKIHQMDDGRDILFEGGEQLRGRARLVGARDRKNHPPMAPQKIRTPCPATPGFQQWLASPAEFAQTGISGNDDLSFDRARRPRVARNDFANQLPAGF